MHRLQGDAICLKLLKLGQIALPFAGVRSVLREGHLGSAHRKEIVKLWSCTGRSLLVSLSSLVFGLQKAGLAFFFFKSELSSVISHLYRIKKATLPTFAFNFKLLLL